MLYFLLKYKYFSDIGSQRLDKLQAEYDYQKNNFLENWDKDEIDITDSQDRAEFNLTLITYIQDTDFKGYKKEKEIQRATEKNDARLEVYILKAIFLFIKNYSLRYIIYFIII